ncbi:MAG: PEP-CTERM sorting domain-containing protein [Gammaproteobacteria bacterium]|nr:PEP-CTERM sorting domain-containing protein [Gammaproteobacteria bacterium]
MNKYFLRLFGTLLCMVSTSSFSATVIFSDGFEGESGYGLNYSSFNNWDITSGSVDLINQGSYSLSCVGNTGRCVDLDGSSNQAGTFSTKQTFNLSPGTYELSFALSGNQRNSSLDVVDVSMSSLFSTQISKNGFDPYELFSFIITVNSPTSTGITFTHQGVDNLGMMLDDVQLVSTVPVPGAVWLLGSGLITLFGLSRRRGCAPHIC